MGMNRRLFHIVALACSIVLAASPGAAARLSARNISPFPKSKLIVGAWWTSKRFNPPPNQWGDILPTVWGDDGDQYTIIDDGGADVPVVGGLWRQSVARISGRPPRFRFRHVGDPSHPPPHTYSQIYKNPKLWIGPLGPYYSSGLVMANHVLFATQEHDWNWNANGTFQGLVGVAYSFDRGQHWRFGRKSFPPPLGNVSWVIRGRGGFYDDRWVYGIASEREFNASVMLMGRSRPDVADLTDPSRWQWVSSTGSGGATPVSSGSAPGFSSSFRGAIPILSWRSRITYPQMAYDSPIRRYLLTFTYSYGARPPGIWQNGAQLVILEAPHPWGPFSFVATERYFGPSNGYAPGFPISWISPNGRDLWLKWGANFDGCARRLNCSGAYGFNYRRLHLRLAGDR